MVNAVLMTFLETVRSAMEPSILYNASLGRFMKMVTHGCYVMETIEGREIKDDQENVLEKKIEVIKTWIFVLFYLKSSNHIHVSKYFAIFSVLSTQKGTEKSPFNQGIAREIKTGILRQPCDGIGSTVSHLVRVGLKYTKNDNPFSISYLSIKKKKKTFFSFMI